MKCGMVLLKVVETNKNWKQVCRKLEIDPGFYAVRHRDEHEAFPWEIIDHGLDRQYLWDEYQQALLGQPGKKCPIGTEVRCRKCGVCK